MKSKSVSILLLALLSGLKTSNASLSRTIPITGIDADNSGVTDKSSVSPLQSKTETNARNLRQFKAYQPDIVGDSNDLLRIAEVQQQRRSAQHHIAHPLQAQVQVQVQAQVHKQEETFYHDEEMDYDEFGEYLDALSQMPDVQPPLDYRYYDFESDGAMDEVVPEGDAVVTQERSSPESHFEEDDDEEEDFEDYYEDGEEVMEESSEEEDLDNPPSPERYKEMFGDLYENGDLEHVAPASDAVKLSWSIEELESNYRKNPNIFRYRFGDGVHENIFTEATQEAINYMTTYGPFPRDQMVMDRIIEAAIKTDKWKIPLQFFADRDGDIAKRNIIVASNASNGKNNYVLRRAYLEPLAIDDLYYEDGETLLTRAVKLNRTADIEYMTKSHYWDKLKWLENVHDEYVDFVTMTIEKSIDENEE